MNHLRDNGHTKRYCKRRISNARYAVLVSLLAFSAYMADGSVHSILISGLPNKSTNILDLRIAKIELEDLTMSDALNQIANAVHRYSHHLYFSFGMSFTQEEDRQYMRKRVPKNKWKLRDPKVKIEASNVTLREVIDRLCVESGWSYEGSTEIGVAFSDDPIISRCLDAEQLSRTDGHPEYYKYDMYGKPKIYNALNTQLSTSNYSVKDLFTGQRWISEISVYDDRNRFMSPDLGRFLQPDPIGFKGDASNLYRYVGNDWANRTDPMGLIPEVWLIRDYTSGTSDDKRRAAGTYFIVDNGKVIAGPWRANKGGPADFEFKNGKQTKGIAEGDYRILAKAEDGKSYPKGQPAITGLTPGLKPGQPNKSYEEGSALVHGPGPSKACVTIPDDGVAKTWKLRDQNGGSLPMHIEDGKANRATPVTDPKGNFILHRDANTSTTGANSLGNSAAAGSSAPPPQAASVDPSIEDVDGVVIGGGRGDPKGSPIP